MFSIDDDDDFSMDFEQYHQRQQQQQQQRMPPTSPSADLAMDMGTDSHKLQLMKASFFVDDEFDGKSVTSEQMMFENGRDSPDQIVPNRPFSRHLQGRAFSGSNSTLSKGLLPSSKGSSIMEVPLHYKESEPAAIVTRQPNEGQVCLDLNFCSIPKFNYIFYIDFSPKHH